MPHNIQTYSKFAATMATASSSSQTVNGVNPSSRVAAIGPSVPKATPKIKKNRKPPATSEGKTPRGVKRKRTPTSKVAKRTPSTNLPQNLPNSECDQSQGLPMITSPLDIDLLNNTAMTSINALLSQEAAGIVKIAAKVTGKSGKKSKSASKRRSKTKDDSAGSHLADTVVEGAAETKTRKKKKPVVTIEDRYPNRIVNPLLRLPRYPGPKGSGINPSLPPELIPNAGELWNIIQLYFPEPDTFPISYLAQILGFEVPLTRPESGFNSFDPQTVPLRFKQHVSKDPWLTVPQEGTFAELVWKRNRRKRNSSIQNGGVVIPTTLDRGHDISSLVGEDDELDYIDPMWKKIVDQFRGYDETFFSLDPRLGQPLTISNDCIKFAQEHGILSHDIIFRFAAIGDELLLSEIAKVRTRTDLNNGLFHPFCH
jgi:hypothetical protein